MREVVLTEKAPLPVGPYSQAVISNGIVYCSGQIGIDPKTSKLVNAGIRDEATQCLINLVHVLEAAGSSMGKALRVTIYLTDMDQFKEVNSIYAGFFKDRAPARTTVGVSRLPLGAMIEIDVIAEL